MGGTTTEPRVGIQLASWWSSNAAHVAPSCPLVALKTQLTQDLLRAGWPLDTGQHAQTPHIKLGRVLPSAAAKHAAYSAIDGTSVDVTDLAQNWAKLGGAIVLHTGTTSAGWKTHMTMAYCAQWGARTFEMDALPVVAQALKALGYAVA